MSKLSAYTKWVGSSPLYGRRSSYYKFLAAVDGGKLARAASILARSGNVDAYPVVAALYYAAYLGFDNTFGADFSGADKAALVALLGGSAVPRSARVDLTSFVRYAASLAGEVAYGDA